MRAILAELGLTRFPSFHRDSLYLAALAAGIVFWVLVAFLLPATSKTAPALTRVLSLCLWQPVLEELVFRGLIQKELARGRLGSRKILGLTAANAITSLLFAALHFFSHPPLWAAAAFVPSLVFGHFRDRYQSLYPPILLHIYYNTGYFLTTGFPT